MKVTFFFTPTKVGFNFLILDMWTIMFHQFSFQVTPNNYAKLREIKELLRLMLDAVSEKLILKPLEKYGARLDELIALDPSLQQQEDKNNETAEGETAEAAASADETAAPGVVTITIFFFLLPHDLSTWWCTR